jgi:hypothetical protein
MNAPAGFQHFLKLILGRTSAGLASRMAKVTNHVRKACFNVTCFESLQE